MSKPKLPFSRTRRLNDTVYLSGILGFNDDGSIPQGITAQTEKIVERMKATLQEEGLSLLDVVSCTCYLTDRADFSEFNKAYAAAFTEPLPVRTTVQTPLMVDALVEITAIAKAR